MRNLYLVGFMGAGKSVVGRALANRLERAFVDLDEAVERRLGMSIPEVFSVLGEPAFRDAETAELEALTHRSGLVVATGGGTFSSPENREHVARSEGISIFLDAPWSEIVARLDGSAGGRPKWSGPDEARLLFDSRRDDYLRATLRFAIGAGETPTEIAGRVADELRERACAS